MVRQTRTITHAHTALSDQAESHETLNLSHPHTGGPERLLLPGACERCEY